MGRSDGVGNHHRPAGTTAAMIDRPVPEAGHRYPTWISSITLSDRIWTVRIWRDFEGHLEATATRLVL